jgi:K+-transporting ATPase ATPase B chain
MIALVEGAKRQKTPNEIALTILLSALTIIFLVVLMALKAYRLLPGRGLSRSPCWSSLLVCLIPTTIGGLLSAIGIAGIDRLVQKNVLAMSGRAVEAAGDVDVLLLDKTGTITLGNRQAVEFIPAPGVTEQQMAEAAQLRRWRTRRRKAAASWCWRRRSITCAEWNCARCRTRCSCRSRRRRG